MSTSAHLIPHARWDPVLRRMGLDSPGDLLARAVCVRDLPDRANLRLEVEGRVAHVKVAKGRRRSPEADALVWARDHGLPTAPLAFSGLDPERGAFVGIEDLAPARPLDDWLREGAPQGAVRRRVLEALADAVARLHGLRHHHRDLYLNHVYVDPRADPALVAIIDWDRLGRHRRRLGRRAVKDLAALDASIPPGSVTARERLRFLARYLRALPDAGGRARLLRLSRRVERKAARIRAHVPRTPVGDAGRPPGGVA